jgi:peptidoglycan/LPS O-acetylase OafA/YrhL
MPAPTRAPARYATLDAWRGIACLLVVVSHSTLFLVHTARPDDGGVGERLVRFTGRMTVGVPLFFVISGYCIAAAAEAARDRLTGVGRYFARRFRRIYPAYWAAVALTVLAVLALERVVARGLVSGPFGPVAVIPDPARVAPSQWVGSLTLTETWRPLVNPSSPEQQLLAPAWTLCYEEQFYAVTGLVLLVARSRFFAGIALVTAVVFAGVVVNWGGVPVKGTFLDGRWLMFAAGVGVYWAVTRGGRAGTAAVVLAILATAGYACRDPDVLLDMKLYSPLADGKELLPACVFALLLLAAHRWDERTAGCRVGRSLAGVGRYSYSLYLVHYPICLAVSHAAYRAGVTGAWATLLLVVPVCVWLSTRAAQAFYRVVERRFAPAPPASDPAPAADPAPAPTRAG